MAQHSRVDKRVVELIGRNRLIDELLRAGLEVAVPARDRGIDLIAYVELKSLATKFIARPIQMKAASAESFSIDRKYAKVHGLILAFVWHVQDPDETVTYALSYPEALDVARARGWTKTPSLHEGSYTMTHPSHEVKKLLRRYEMTPDKWWRKIVGSAKPVSNPR
jgi:hypothetical protein